MELRDFMIRKDESVKETLKKLDKTAEKVLLIADKEGKLLGTITDGDIRRHILKGRSLDENIAEAYNQNPTFIKKEEMTTEKTRHLFIQSKLDLIPIVDRDHRVVEFITWDQAFSEERTEISVKKSMDIPVVIMAGGKGARLEPFSKILPKSLIPIGEKPIIEIVIDEFRKQGADKFYLTLNYKADMIEAYFNSIEKNYEVVYVKEDEYLGTAGSLCLIGKNIGTTFIVSNSDVIVKANLEEVINLHKKQKASLTVLSSVQHHRIPYGVIKFEKGGKVTDILEKPEYTFMINAGVYVLDKQIFNFIPEKTYFDMTDLIKALIEKDKKVITYPVNESNYIDVGEWQEYKKAIERMKPFV